MPRTEAPLSIQMAGRVLINGQGTYLGPEISDETAWNMYRKTLDPEYFIPQHIWKLWDLANWESIHLEEVSADMCFLNEASLTGIHERSHVALYWHDAKADSESMLIIPLTWFERNSTEWFRPGKRQLLVTWNDTHWIGGQVDILEVNILQAHSDRFRSYPHERQKDFDWLGDLLEELDEGLLTEEVKQQIIISRLNRLPSRINSELTRGKPVFAHYPEF